MNGINNNVTRKKLVGTTTPHSAREIMLNVFLRASASHTPTYTQRPRAQRLIVKPSSFQLVFLIIHVFIRYIIIVGKIFFSKIFSLTDY